MLLVKQTELLALERLGDLLLEGTDHLGVFEHLAEALFTQSILHIRITEGVSELTSTADFTDDILDDTLLDSVDRDLVQELVDPVCNTCHTGLLHQAGTQSSAVLLIQVIIEVGLIGHIVTGDSPQVVCKDLDQAIDIAS